MTSDRLTQFLPLLFIVAVVYVLVRAPRWRPANSSPSSQASRTVRFRNPANGYEEDVGTPWVWCLLFGCIYFTVRGIWTHAVAALLLAGITAGVSWLVYPFFVRLAVEWHYLRKGWLLISN